MEVIRRCGFLNIVILLTTKATDIARKIGEMKCRWSRIVLKGRLIKQMKNRDYTMILNDFETPIDKTRVERTNTTNAM